VQSIHFRLLNNEKANLRGGQRPKSSEVLAQAGALNAAPRDYPVGGVVSAHKSNECASLMVYGDDVRRVGLGSIRGNCIRSRNRLWPIRATLNAAR
jgi:hypothetical protein